MKLKCVAQIHTGKLKIYEENDMENPAYTVNVETTDNEYYKMKIRNKENELISEVLYVEDIKRKFMMVSEYIIHDLKTGEKIMATSMKGHKLYVGDNKEMYLTRSLRDRKMMFYDKDKLIMSLKCKTIIRNWLLGKYNIEILDENRISLCVSVMAVMFKVIFDEHNCTSLTC